MLQLQGLSRFFRSPLLFPPCLFLLVLPSLFDHQDVTDDRIKSLDQAMQDEEEYKKRAAMVAQAKIDALKRKALEAREPAKPASSCFSSMPLDASLRASCRAWNGSRQPLQPLLPPPGPDSLTVSAAGQQKQEQSKQEAKKVELRKDRDRPARVCRASGRGYRAMPWKGPRSLDRFPAAHLSLQWANEDMVAVVENTQVSQEDYGRGSEKSERRGGS
eukprot:756898-Hanusia_phi.AAC.2